MSKYTPGPWQWYGSNDLTQCAPPSKTILESGCHGGYDSCGGFIEWGENKEANMALIAAAPSLLEALREATKALQDNVTTYIFGTPTDVCMAINKATKAIAKAEGNAND